MGQGQSWLVCSVPRGEPGALWLPYWANAAPGFTCGHSGIEQRGAFSPSILSISELLFPEGSLSHIINQKRVNVIP